MASALLRLHGTVTQAIADETARLTEGGDVGAWDAAMQAILARAHIAAALIGLAERAHVRLKAAGTVSGPSLLAQARGAVRHAIDRQLTYLRGFVADVRAGVLSAAQTLARAALYAGPIRATYMRARFPGLPFYPTEGSECKANCKCAWRDNGDGSFDWVMGAAEHCPTCQTRAAGNPYQVEAA